MTMSLTTQSMYKTHAQLISKHKYLLWRWQPLTNNDLFALFITICSLPIGEAILLRVSRAYAIWSGLGMSIQGVRTCGDYMFSGHTVALTIMNFFITECKWNVIHRMNIKCLIQSTNNHTIKCFNWNFRLFFRHAASSLLFAYDDMDAKHVWHIFHFGRTRTLFHRCICRILYHIKTVPLLSYACK